MNCIRREKRPSGRRILVSFLISVLLVFLLPDAFSLAAKVAHATQTTVVSFRHFSTEGYTRVVLVLNRKTLDFRSGVMHNPPRIYVDIPEGRLKPGFRLPRFEETSLARKMTVRLLPGKTIRLILSLTHAGIRHNIFSLTSPHRIVLDLRETTPRPPKVSASRSKRAPPESSHVEANHFRRRKSDSPRRVQEANLPKARGEKRKALNLTQRFEQGLGRVVLDPGHGGRDPGATGLYGLVEKDLVLDISKRTLRTLRERLPRGNKIYLTRSRDRFLSLEARTAYANDKDADVFVSIHVNSSPLNYTRGVETYLLSEASTPRALELAALESGTTVARLSDLQKILNDLMLRSKVDESLNLAERVQSSMISRIDNHYNGVKDLGVKRGPFYVLLGANMASVLTEIAFVSNPREAKRLRTPKYRQAIADGIAEGIIRFVGLPPHIKKRYTSRK